MKRLRLPLHKDRAHGSRYTYIVYIPYIIYIRIRTNCRVAVYTYTVYYMCTGYILLPYPAAINNVPTRPRNFSLFSHAPGDRHYAGALISITRSGVPSALAGPTIHFAHCVRDPLPTTTYTYE